MTLFELNWLMDSLRKVSIAPMIDWTDKHFRYFLRLIAPSVYLYTEMVVADALCFGDKDYLLAHSPFEYPLALQLGGSEPKRLAQAAKLGETYGYSEINLNVGCPSDRVQAGRFGACLMKEPSLVRDCIQAMGEVVDIPVTVKTRIGVDKQDSFEDFLEFIETVAKAPCEVFIIHARKAWLNGLSPKENRTIPPLKYDFVKRIKSLFPQLTFIVNGGINDLDRQNQFASLDGIMVGREAYQNPYHLAALNKEEHRTRKEILMAYTPYVASELEKGVKLPYMLRHLLGMAHGVAGGRLWRQQVSNNKHQTLADYEALCQSFPES